MYEGEQNLLPEEKLGLLPNDVPLEVLLDDSDFCYLKRLQAHATIRRMNLCNTGLSSEQLEAAMEQTLYYMADIRNQVMLKYGLPVDTISPTVTG